MNNCKKILNSSSPALFLENGFKEKEKRDRR